jgi:hypothetical protein
LEAKPTFLLSFDFSFSRTKGITSLEGGRRHGRFCYKNLEFAGFHIKYLLDRSKEIFKVSAAVFLFRGSHTDKYCLTFLIASSKGVSRKNVLFKRFLKHLLQVRLMKGTLVFQAVQPFT